MCDLASSEIIRVAATAHVLATEAKTKLGVSDLVTEREKVCKVLEEYIDIRGAVDKVVRARETASLEELGIHIIYSNSDSDSCRDSVDVDEREKSVKRKYD